MSHIPTISIDGCVDYYDVVECYENWASDGYRTLCHCPSDEFAQRLAEDYGALNDSGLACAELSRVKHEQDHKEAMEMSNACLKYGRFYIAWGFIAAGCTYCGRTSVPTAKEILDEFRGKVKLWQEEPSST